jgi:hypothetical protein
MCGECTFLTFVHHLVFQAEQRISETGSVPQVKRLGVPTQCSEVKN